MWAAQRETAVADPALWAHGYPRHRLASLVDPGVAGVDAAGMRCATAGRASRQCRPGTVHGQSTAGHGPPDRCIDLAGLPGHHAGSPRGSWTSLQDARPVEPTAAALADTAGVVG